MHYRYWLVILLPLLAIKMGYSQVLAPPAVLANVSLVTLPSLGSVALKPINQVDYFSVIKGSSTCACKTGCTVLPVQLLSFEGKRLSASNVHLNWVTTNELNNKGFNIEASYGDATTFKYLQFVPTLMSNTIEKKYALVDNNSFTGITYYRLLQMDINGSSTYSNIVKVDGINNNPLISIYPNPVIDKLGIQINSNKSEAATVFITDAYQRVIITQNVALSNQINTIVIPVSHLARGIYFVRIVGSELNLYTGKFIK